VAAAFEQETLHDLVEARAALTPPPLAPVGEEGNASGAPGGRAAHTRGESPRREDTPW
jgi:hypothetical protein